jgi:cell division transport system ATP-binding protein
MYTLDNVSVTYPSGVLALDGVSLTVPRGAWLLITGVSGSGKSTLLATLRGDQEPTTGAVLFERVNLYKLRGETIAEYRRQIGSAYQDPHFIGHLSVAENISLVMEHAGKTPAEIDTDVPYVLDLMGLGAYADRYPHELSGGERQRLQLARAFVHQPEVLLVDEPLAHLDSANAERVISLLKTLHEMGTTLVVTAHAKQAFHSHPTDTITLDRGSIVKH